MKISKRGLAQLRAGKTVMVRIPIKPQPIVAQCRSGGPCSDVEWQGRVGERALRRHCPFRDALIPMPGSFMIECATVAKVSLDVEPRRGWVWILHFRRER